MLIIDKQLPQFEDTYCIMSLKISHVLSIKQYLIQLVKLRHYRL